MREIPNIPGLVRIAPLTGGISGDEKYRVETADGETLLLRVSGAAEAERKRAEFAMLGRAWAAGVPVPRPVAFGACDGGCGVYALAAWLEGEDVRSALANRSASARFRLGEKCGELLKKLHALPSPEDAEPWGARFRRKAQARIAFYGAHPLGSPDADAAARHLLERQELLNARPQTFNHGDFNPENIILAPSGAVGAIDFNAFNGGYGDPWWEFSAVIWGEDADGPYLSGLIGGYFGAPPPPEFFSMLRYYFAYDALAALCDTSEGDGGAPEDGRRHMGNVSRWFDGFRADVPSWYRKMGGVSMTTVYFVRHAQTNYENRDDRARELTEKGLADRALVTEYLADKGVSAVYSSPYRRAADTVRPFAEQNDLAIQFVDGFRERGVDNVWIDDFDAFARRQWADFAYGLAGGESLGAVQARNVAALGEVLRAHPGEAVAIGSHGTALSTVIHFYDPSFGYDDFEKIRPIMPLIVKFTFEGEACAGIQTIDLLGT